MSVEMLTIKLPTSSRYTDPRTGGSLFRPGVRGCVLKAGAQAHEEIGALPSTQRVVLLDGHQVRVIEVRLTYIDALTENDVLLQIIPSWRTPEGAEAGLVTEHGNSFGRILTVIHFQVI